MYFYLQSPELLSGKAFNSILDILHFYVRNVSYLIFDDTVINNKLGYNIELTRRQYSGIGSSSCLRSISCEVRGSWNS